VEQTPPALILLRSPVVDLLDFAERVMPVLTPQTLIDEKPRMNRGPRAKSQGPETSGFASRFTIHDSPVARRTGR
jgi:hypothetical protein